MLLFKKKFLEAIRRGEKTQTIRLWKHRRMRVGQLSYIPGFGRVRITTVEPVRVEDLTDADATPDGFADADSLRRELRLLYAEQIAAGHQAYRVCFEPAPQADAPTPKGPPVAEQSQEPRPRRRPR